MERSMMKKKETQKSTQDSRLHRFHEQVIDARQAELQHQERENQKLNRKLDSLKRELADARSQSKSKTKQLQDARDHILRLQPRRRDISEAEAQEGYKQLCGKVQRWVQNWIAAVLDHFEAARLGARPLAGLAARFASLIREPAKRWLGAHEAEEHHVIAVIMYHLWLAFFSKSFYCPLDGSSDEATIRWIDELQKTMSRLPRARCREWRSETLTALTSQPLFRSRRDAYISLVSEDLASLLSTVVPRSSSPAHLRESVRETMVEPAADLAHRLQLASSVFSLKWPARNAGSRLEVYECIDLVSGGLVTEAAAGRQGVTYLFDLAPGLFVERIEVGRRAPLKAIYRPTVLVHTGGGGGDHVLQRPRTLIKWLCESVTDPLARMAVPRSKKTDVPSTCAVSDSDLALFNGAEEVTDR
ncbi:hypothetical protein GQ602_000814 [Ophiocordyceps camponoti-floridani]|uniref:Uncharacterized protein n=1 Tax=Ophiocordyceps camponoti-floridani TaxID=2030778 RepID=A0A8H4VGU7_9HYPO|nr:hypothetical protein GQ602_000814 [Ophiocordyceps camponoti-floridani]